MMRIVTRAAVVALVAGLAGGCITQAGTATTPNPAPPPGYRVECASYPIGFGAITSRCTPVAPASRPVIRSKG